jgi:hypothetical protein
MPAVPHNEEVDMRAVILPGIFVLLLSACAPEPGSEAWCKKMDKTPKEDWSMNEAAEYARSCVLGLRE